MSAHYNKLNGKNKEWQYTKEGHGRANVKIDCFIHIPVNGGATGCTRITY